MKNKFIQNFAFINSEVELYVINQNIDKFKNEISQNINISEKNLAIIWNKFSVNQKIEIIKNRYLSTNFFDEIIKIERSKKVFLNILKNNNFSSFFAEELAEEKSDSYRDYLYFSGKLSCEARKKLASQKFDTVYLLEAAIDKKFINYNNLSALIEASDMKFDKKNKNLLAKVYFENKKFKKFIDEKFFSSLINFYSTSSLANTYFNEINKYISYKSIDEKFIIFSLMANPFLNPVEKNKIDVIFRKNLYQFLPYEDIEIYEKIFVKIDKIDIDYNSLLKKSLPNEFNIVGKHFNIRYLLDKANDIDLIEKAKSEISNFDNNLMSEFKPPINSFYEKTKNQKADLKLESYFYQLSPDEVSALTLEVENIFKQELNRYDFLGNFLSELNLPIKDIINVIAKI